MRVCARGGIFLFATKGCANESSWNLSEFYLEKKISEISENTRPQTADKVVGVENTPGRKSAGMRPAYWLFMVFTV